MRACKTTRVSKNDDFERSFVAQKKKRTGFHFEDRLTRCEFREKKMRRCTARVATYLKVSAMISNKC